MLKRRSDVALRLFFLLLCSWKITNFNKLHFCFLKVHFRSLVFVGWLAWLGYSMTLLHVLMYASQLGWFNGCLAMIFLVFGRKNGNIVEVHSFYRLEWVVESKKHSQIWIWHFSSEDAVRLLRVAATMGKAKPYDIQIILGVNYF